MTWYVLINTFYPGYNGKGTVISVHKTPLAALESQRRVQPKERGSYLPTAIRSTEERLHHGDVVRWRDLTDAGEEVEQVANQWGG